MEKLARSLSKRSIDTIETNKLVITSIDYRTIDKSKINSNKKLSTSQAEEIIEQALSLISDLKFKPFFYKTLYLIGPEAFYEAMDFAAKSKAQCKECIFVKRLKEYRNQCEQ